MSTPSPFQSPATAQSLTRWDEDPTLYLFTSLTAGSSHIITATARIGTILKAARIPHVAVDTATDEGARKLWGRRAKGKKLPGLVKEGFVIAVSGFLFSEDNPGFSQAFPSLAQSLFSTD